MNLIFRENVMVSFKPEVIRDLCIEFRGDILEDFPAGHPLITCWCTIAFSRNIRFMSTRAEILEKISLVFLKV